MLESGLLRCVWACVGVDRGGGCSRYSLSVLHYMKRRYREEGGGRVAWAFTGVGCVEEEEEEEGIGKRCEVGVRSTKRMEGEEITVRGCEWVGGWVSVVGEERGGVGKGYTEISKSWAAVGNRGQPWVSRDGTVLASPHYRGILHQPRHLPALKTNGGDLGPKSLESPG